MGCGGSVGSRKLTAELKATEDELLLERRHLEQKDEHHAGLRECLQEQACSENEASVRSISELRATLQARRAEHEHALEEQRTTLACEHEVALCNALEERDGELQRELDERLTAVQAEALEEREVSERLHLERTCELREGAEAQHTRHLDAAEEFEREATALRRQLSPLRQERNNASESLAEARASLDEGRIESSSFTNKLALLERELVAAKEDHTRSEQRFADLERHLRGQTSHLQEDLRTRTDELHQRNTLLRQRDQELLEVNCQLADLQGVFDDVNRQLQTECGRIEKLQGTVSLCAKQSKELDSLQGMLEDSHRMLAQVREALEVERTERAKTSGLLEHEQQRTQLLLDVLKHFKEKLQGLTPQMLLNRLGEGCSDPKALLSSMKTAADGCYKEFSPLPPVPAKTGNFVASSPGGLHTARAQPLNIPVTRMEPAPFTYAASPSRCTINDDPPTTERISFSPNLP